MRPRRQPCGCQPTHPPTPPLCAPSRPALQADSIWCDTGDSIDNPSPCGRLLIRRLELESHIARGARCRTVCAGSSEPLRAALPPLELPTLCAAKHGAATPRSAAAAAAAAAAAGLAAPTLHGAALAAVEVPDSFLCPLSQRVMTDPVVTPGESGWRRRCCCGQSGGRGARVAGQGRSPPKGYDPTWLEITPPPNCGSSLECTTFLRRSPRTPPL
jgi:hypothetical protein